MAGDPSAATVQLASDAVQTQERLLLNLRQRLQGNDQPIEGWRITTNVIDECKAIKDKLREVKSLAEGSAVEFESIALACSSHAATAISNLRQRLLQHVSTELTPDQKQACLSLVNDIFQHYWKKLLFAAFISCPWYVSTQDECCRQAKHNQLLLVYVSKDNQFFAPVNRHVKEKNGDVFEHEGWLYAAEVFHFVHYVSKGKVRFIESLYLPNSCVIYSDEHWHELVRLSTDIGICGMSSFLEQCRGQAVGAVGRKRKKNGMVLRESATLYDFCDSYRLLQHASTVIMENNINVSLPVDSLPQATEALSVLRSAYHHEIDADSGTGNYKEMLFRLVLQWKSNVDDQMSKFHFTEYNVVKRMLEKWLGQVRLHNMELLPLQPPKVDELQRSKLASLMHVIGGSVSEISPEHIILIARAGSHLYDLAKADSDADYVIIYADPLQKVISATTRASESKESRGLNQIIEFGAYEVRFLAEMLWKGSVVMLELVFAENLDYYNEAWSLLTRNREMFVTEQSILQYFGLIKNNMVAIKSDKNKGTPKELKLFYQIFHKLHCLEYLLRREYPKIKCEGETREFIMGIRNSNPLEFPRDVFLKQACDKIDSLKQAFNERSNRLPEYVNYGFLLNWIMTVRGVKYHKG